MVKVAAEKKRLANRRRSMNKKRKLIQKQRASQWSEMGLKRDRRERGHYALANKLTLRELSRLSRRVTNVESKKLARETFITIAKKYGVSSGDLEQALGIKLGARKKMTKM